MTTSRQQPIRVGDKFVSPIGSIYQVITDSGFGRVDMKLNGRTVWNEEDFNIFYNTSLITWSALAILFSIALRDRPSSVAISCISIRP